MTVELKTIDALRTQVAAWRAAGEGVALVPTMGALHRGHMALVAEAKKHAKRVVVSIFVNPTQFGPTEDFSRYPRPIARDMELLAEAGADAAWLPDMALFGEKDYQQLCLIKQLVRDLDMPVRIIGVLTIREEDGLALSSRNQYLDATQREAATAIYAAMKQVSVDIHKGVPSGEALLKGRKMLIDAGFTRIDYFDMHDSADLSDRDEPPARLLVAAWLGTTRLIDNMAI